MDGKRLLPTFLNGPGCTDGTAINTFDFKPSNFNIETSTSCSSLNSSRKASKGAFKSATQFSRKALKMGMDCLPIERFPIEFRRNIKQKLEPKAKANAITEEAKTFATSTLFGHHKNTKGIRHKEG